MSDEKVYLELIEHLRGWIFGLPDSEYLIPMLKLRCTPEEAEIASVIKCGHGASINSFESLETIFEKVKHLGYSIKE